MPDQYKPSQAQEVITVLRTINTVTTIVVKEKNWKRYEQLAGQKLTEGKGDLSFGSYVNMCMEKANFSLDELIEFLKRSQK